MAPSNDELTRHWHRLRGRTYDLLAALTLDDLDRKLPFARSQSIGYQFWCMLGTQESWVAYLQNGALEHWSCSLRGVPPADRTPALFRERLQAADEEYLAALAAADLLQSYAPGGLTPLGVHQMLVEHEAHHHGQLINFIYALDLPIPPSWAEQWALSRG